MRDEEKTSSNVVSDEARHAGGKRNERGDETGSADGDWREEDEFFVDEARFGMGDGGSDDGTHRMAG